jgi:ABC-type branched-subunit amino acid transport system substrate-binding protein
MKKLIICFATVLFLAGCTASDGILFQDSDAFRVGWFGPLTGDMASYGQMAQETLRLRFEQINEAGGIDGKPVEVIWEDGKCNPKEASLAVQKLINIDKVNVIFGSCSGTMLSAIPITEKQKVLLLTAFATTPELSGAGEYFFRTVPSDSSQGRVLAEYANEHFSKVGMIVEQTDYAMGVAAKFEEVFSGEVVREDFLTTESDFRTRITKLKNAEVEALVLFPQSPPKFDLLVTQLEDLKWNTPILGDEIMVSTPEVIGRHVAFLSEHAAVGANFIEPTKEAFLTIQNAMVVNQHIKIMSQRMLI